MRVRVSDNAPFGSQRSTRRRNPGGLTLMETALATVIVGLAVLSIVKLVTAVTQQNFYSQKTTTALMLANNIRELLVKYPLTNANNTVKLATTASTSITGLACVEDFNKFTASPPVDANGVPIPGMSNWQQSVTVKHMVPGSFNSSTSVDAQNITVDRVFVTISYDSTGTGKWVPITTMEWLKGRS